MRKSVIGWGSEGSEPIFGQRVKVSEENLTLLEGKPNEPYYPHYPNLNLALPHFE
jgi:hypothetical protein